jgi:hypothetical protein
MTRKQRSRNKGEVSKKSTHKKRKIIDPDGNKQIVFVRRKRTD